MQTVIKRLKSKTYWAALTGAALTIIEANSGMFSQLFPPESRPWLVLAWPLVMISLREVTTGALGDK